MPDRWNRHFFLEKIQKSKNPKTQKPKNPKIQKSKNPKPQNPKTPEGQPAFFLNFPSSQYQLYNIGFEKSVFY